MGTPLQNNVKNLTAVAENFKYKLLLDQSDMYSHILSKFPDDKIEPKMIIWVLLEYIRYIKIIIVDNLEKKFSLFYFL